MAKKGEPRVAIIHDWLTNMGGAERAVLAFHAAFPDAPVYTSVYRPEALPLFEDVTVRTTWLQKVPFASKAHQLFAYFRPAAFRSLKLDEYDVLLSSCSAESKHAQGKKAIHICYCHTPTRYFWSHYDEYLANPGLGRANVFARPLLKLSIGLLRKKDLEGAKYVHTFVANSTEVQQRISTYYHRSSLVLNPPIETDRFKLYTGQRDDYYLVSGRQVPYKRFDLAVAACNKLEAKLIVIGKGPDHEKLKTMAGPTVQFVSADDQEIVTYFQRAKALLYPGLEDAGITPLEAMSTGTPVIAYGKGGVLDTIRPGVDGLFFEEQTVDSLIVAMRKLEKSPHIFVPEAIRAHTEQWSTEAFIKNIQRIVKESFADSKNSAKKT